MAGSFKGSFTQQEPISAEAIKAAMTVLHHGRLHRYNLEPGEAGEVALLEQEFAAFIGASYCLAVASGGYAMATALRAVGVKPGDKVLSNAFTLAPVPGAIASLAAIPVLVECTSDLTIDLVDLERKIRTSSSGYLLLSHMRGHVCDMSRLIDICERASVLVIEDCAHTMGASWQGIPSGRHGIVSCYSTQTYKHLNSGEGGLLISDDADIMARAILLSGSYMLYERHLASPPAQAFEQAKYVTPNISGRMDNLRAAILRPQLRQLENKCVAWTERYRIVENGLRNTPGLNVIHRPEIEAYVGSSIQFLLMGWTPADVQLVINRCAERGVELKWFGAENPVGFTSKHSDWQYFDTPPLPQTQAVLAGLMDMRLPLTFSLKDCEQIAGIIRSEVSAVYQNSAV
ncbi:MAG: DegT/DnrJ/EryC1/StrS family aminotransferase [Paracoccaceae bacterium]